MRRISFSLKQLLFLVLCICILLGIWEVLTITFSIPQIPARSNIVRVGFENSKLLPYRVGGVTCRTEVDWWLRCSRMSRPPAKLKKYCELSFLDFNSELLELVVFQDSNPSNRNALYFSWKGRYREATYSEFMIAVDANSRNCRYEDRNEDGEVDTKIQLLDTNADLIWEDSDHDGIFDTEYLFDNSKRQKAYSTTIQIPTPSKR